MLFQVVISELAFLAIDVNMEHARNNINSLKGVRYWKVGRLALKSNGRSNRDFQAAGYALLAEIADMDLQYIESIVVPYGKQVSEIHFLCVLCSRHIVGAHKTHRASDAFLCGYSSSCNGFC
jgi:hypothetical protein